MQACKSQMHPHVSHYIMCVVKNHEMGWSSGELLQCMIMALVSFRLLASLKGQNKYSKCFLFQKNPLACSSLGPALFKVIYCYVKHFKLHSHLLNSLFTKLLRCTKTCILVHQIEQFHTLSLFNCLVYIRFSFMSNMLPSRGQ